MLIEQFIYKREMVCYPDGTIEVRYVLAVVYRQV